MRKVGEIKMKKENKNQGYALLYAILVMFLFMITVSAVMFSSLADVRQYKKTKASTEAWMLAQSGIESGIANPTNSCSSPSIVEIVPGQPLEGTYTLKVCPFASPKYIESLGKFSGTQIKLRAENYDSSANIKIFQIGI